MKILLYSFISIFLFIAIFFVYFSISSRKQPELGLINGQLRACPVTPNCVCSEQQVQSAFVEPIAYATTADDAWRSVKQVVVENGGTIVAEQNGYLRANFVTSLMRYIDDVELRIDETKKVIHIRSASRVGHSDLGANRARVSRLREAFLHKAE